MTFSKTGLLASCLFVSLVGNMLLAGVILGGHYAARETVEQQFLKRLDELVEHIPADQRQRVETVITPARVSVTDKRKILLQQRALIHEQLRADTIDPKRMEIEFAHYRALSVDLQKAIQSMMLDVVMVLPTDARRQLIEDPKAGQ